MEVGGSKPESSKHLPALDGVRGLALLSVLMLHLLPLNPHPMGSFPTRLVGMVIASGWVGVDLFFALSGFLITGILIDTLHGRHFFRNFYARRALRIFPLYFGFFAVIISISVALGYHWTRTTFLYLTYTQNLVISTVPATNTPWADVAAFWTLAVEEQFYLLWPLALFLLRKRRHIFIFAACGALLSLGVRVYLEFSGDSAVHLFRAYEWTPARLDTLLYGAMLAVLVRSRLRSAVLARAPIAAAAGVVVLFAYMLLRSGLFFTSDPLLRTVGLAVVGATSASLVAAAQQPGLIERFFRLRVLRFFGRYSYGMYVLHFTVLRVVQQWMLVGLRSRLKTNWIAVTIVAVVALFSTIALSLLSFHFFEQPLLRLKRFFPNSSNENGRPSTTSALGPDGVSTPT